MLNLNRTQQNLKKGPQIQKSNRDNLPIGMEKSSRAKVRLRVPPITRTGCATAGTQYALIHPIQLGPILLTLQNLLSFTFSLPLQPRLNTLILIIKIRHIHHQILYHKHMWQRRHRRFFSRFYLRQTRQPITAVDVHRAGPAYPLTTRSPKSERWIDLVLDLDESVEDHGPTLLEVDLVVLKLRFCRVVGAPTVDLEGLEVGFGSGRGRDHLSLSLRGVGSCEDEFRRRRGLYPS